MRFLLLLAACVCPAIVMAADSSFSFTPPITDKSVVFLSDIFGVVDGVLHGTGSQIMGAMFSVLNAAVLALGGIVIMYTLIVGTMNTAHEGEMLGHKWSSVWIPVRATLGLALLLPKASGYCLIQIFVMWVVVQGVGAADKVWNAALSYLNNGGKVVQAQAKSSTSTSNKALGAIYTGAGSLLVGQVCMLGLQTQIEQERAIKKQTSGNGGICDDTDPANKAYAEYCNSAVPSFIDTVDFLAIQGASSATNNTYTASMPNFPPDSVYSSFNKRCGEFTWSPMPVMPESQYMTTMYQNTRALALQQMYDDLSQVARSMVSNDPQLTPTSSGDSAYNYTDPFGVPKQNNGNDCVNSSNTCTGWGIPTGGTGSALFVGSEFVSAVYDYNGIMMSAINMQAQSQNSATAAASRAFIADTESSGWMTAGQYFFDLVKLSGSATASANSFDTNTGFPAGVQNVSLAACDTTNDLYCKLYTDSLAQPIITLIKGPVDKDQSAPVLTGTRKTITDQLASTTYGYINNASMVQLPGQPGLTTPDIGISMNIEFEMKGFNWPHQNTPTCHGIDFTCWVRYLLAGFYNNVLVYAIHAFSTVITPILNWILEMLVILPMMTLNELIISSMASVMATGNNPIVALAQMGNSFITLSIEWWITFGSLGVIWSFFIGMGNFILTFALPLITAWMAILLALGFTTAYYIPFYPYMIFIFGVIAWLMAVIEAMVAAPIVALGITHPEGEGMLGKGEQALMILMNVFLRPAMMIIGYIAGIAMCYIGVWVLNTGFAHVAEFTTGSSQDTIDNGYVNWTSLYASFFSIVIYTSMYLTIVQKSFTLIYALPDKVLRWIGGQSESVGQELAHWSDETKQKMQKAEEETGKGVTQMTGKAVAAAQSVADDSKGDPKKVDAK